MAMAICPNCGGIVLGDKEHKCPYNVIMTQEDKEALNFTNSK